MHDNKCKTSKACKKVKVRMPTEIPHLWNLINYKNLKTQYKYS